ncbi:MAG: phage holin family protein [Bacillota bacterium]
MLKRFLLNAVVLVVIEWLLPGVEAPGGSAGILLAAAVLGVVNAIIRPVLLVLTLPFNLLTLGLFTLVVNALMMQLTAAIVPSFSVAGFWWALVAATLFSVMSVLFSLALE